MRLRAAAHHRRRHTGMPHGCRVPQRPQRLQAMHVPRDAHRLVRPPQLYHMLNLLSDALESWNSVCSLYCTLDEHRAHSESVCGYLTTLCAFWKRNPAVVLERRNYRVRTRHACVCVHVRQGVATSRQTVRIDITIHVTYDTGVRSHYSSHVQGPHA